MALLANLSEGTAPAERRRSPRHRLTLDVETRSPGDSDTEAVIHELSQTGFLMETAAEVSTGELLHLRLPETSAVSARVIWSCGRYFGCEFERPISSAATSAALLRSRPGKSVQPLPPGLRFEPTDVGEGKTVGPTAGMSSNRLSLVLVLSIALWSVVAAMILYVAL